MKIVRNVIISGGLLRSDGSPAVVGDSVRIYLEDGNDIVVQITAVSEVNCSYDRIYSFSYNYPTIIRACDVVDGGEVLDCCGVLSARMDILEGVNGRAIPIWNTTQLINQYLTISGTTGNEVINISDTP